MKNKICVLIFISILCSLFSSCGNESKDIWAKYRSEDFCATVKYEQYDVEICARITVERGEANRITAEFSSPEALRGTVATFNGEEFILRCNGVEIRGEAVKKLLSLPLMLSSGNAISFERQTERERRQLKVKTENGEMIFDIDTGELVSAELDGISCDIIDFYWQEQDT